MGDSTFKLVLWGGVALLAIVTILCVIYREKIKRSLGFQPTYSEEEIARFSQWEEQSWIPNWVPGLPSSMQIPPEKKKYAYGLFAFAAYLAIAYFSGSSGALPSLPNPCGGCPCWVVLPSLLIGGGYLLNNATNPSTESTDRDVALGSGTACNVAASSTKPNRWESALRATRRQKPLTTKQGSTEAEPKGVPPPGAPAASPRSAAHAPQQQGDGVHDTKGSLLLAKACIDEGIAASNSMKFIDESAIKTAAEKVITNCKDAKISADEQQVIETVQGTFGDDGRAKCPYGRVLKVFRANKLPVIYKA